MFHRMLYPVYVLHQLTWADLQLLVLVDWLHLMGAADLLNERPKLLALSQRVEKQPKIAAWIKNRPVTAF
jgi:glutathione S-transferase